MRPEFDVTLAYNPDSVLVPVARIEGIGWTAARRRHHRRAVRSSAARAAWCGWTAAPIRSAPRVLFVKLGSGASDLSGNSRAAQWMLLDQLIDEARGRIAPDSHVALLTPAGRAALAKYLGGGGRVVVERAIAPPTSASCCAGRRATTCASRSPAAPKRGSSRRNSPRPRCRCSSIRWPTCRRTSTSIGATLDNAARLRAAGVQVGFTQARRRLAQRAQGAPARRQCGRQRPAVGGRPGRR